MQVCASNNSSCCALPSPTTYAVAAIGQSGLHIATDAFTLPWPGYCRADSVLNSRCSMLQARGTQQQRLVWDMVWMGSGSVGDARECTRHSGGRRSSLAALASVGTAVEAVVGSAVVVEEAIVAAKERRAISRGVNGMSELAKPG